MRAVAATSAIGLLAIETPMVLAANVDDAVRIVPSTLLIILSYGSAFWYVAPPLLIMLEPRHASVNIGGGKDGDR